jgi:hypothetical protein
LSMKACQPKAHPKEAPMKLRSRFTASQRSCRQQNCVEHPTQLPPTTTTPHISVADCTGQDNRLLFQLHVCLLQHCTNLHGESSQAALTRYNLGTITKVSKAESFVMLAVRDHT